MKQVAAKMKLELAAFRELAAFAQFASDLDRTTRAQLERGLRSQEVLKQPQFEPFSLAKEVTIIYALTNGYLDDVPIDKVRAVGKRVPPLHGDGAPRDPRDDHERQGAVRRDHRCAQGGDRGVQETSCI